MADNIAVTAGTGTSIAADDIGAGLLVQRVKTTWGPDGTANDADVASGKPLPAQIRSSAGTAMSFGAGATDTGTVRVTIDTTQIGALSTATFAYSGGFQPVALPSDQVLSSGAHVGTMSFTPAATNHLALDVVGGAISCTSMGLASKSVMITSASVEIDSVTAQSTAWRLHLYNVTPPSASADDAAWDLPSGDRTAYLGQIDLGTAVDQGSTQWVEVNGINKQVRLGATPSIHTYLVNVSALTTAAVAHIVNLHTVEV